MHIFMNKFGNRSIVNGIYSQSQINVVSVPSRVFSV